MRWVVDAELPQIHTLGVKEQKEQKCFFSPSRCIWLWATGILNLVASAEGLASEDLKAHFREQLLVGSWPNALGHSGERRKKKN